MIQYLDWIPQLESVEGVRFVKNEIMVFSYSDIMTLVKRENPFHYQTISTPHKFDFSMFIFHKEGHFRLKIDMEEYEIDTPYNFIRILPGQIVSFENNTPDFDADVVIMSQSFMEDMGVYMRTLFDFRLRTKMGYVTRCQNDEEIAIADFFVKALKHVLANTENPYRKQVAQHSIMALFYSSEHVIHNSINEDSPYTNADMLSKEFMKLVKENFRKERQLQFYADKLCITPRYLSRVVKECTQSSAADWIERFVVLEARALLKSTNMTIQQISDELNFPSQTFFGKYFKRRVGISPKEYRRLG